MRVGVKPHQLGASIEDLRRAWREADESPFESLWVFDHLYNTNGNPTFDALSLLAAMAVATRRIRIGVLVLNATLRHPAATASAAATIDHLSGGRLELGLGAGSGFGAQDIQAQTANVPPVGERLARLEESCEIVTRMWSGEALEFRGEHYTLSGARIGAPPVQRDIPLIVGGASRRAMRIAAKFAREWNVSGPAPDEYCERIATLQSIVAKTGRTVARSVQVRPAELPGLTFREVVAAYEAAGADRVVLILDPPYEPGAVERLARGVFG